MGPISRLPSRCNHLPRQTNGRWEFPLKIVNKIHVKVRKKSDDSKTYLHPIKFGTVWFRITTVGAWCERVPKEFEVRSLLWPKIELVLKSLLLNNSF